MNILIKPVWILLENEVQDTIGHEDYGRYSAMFSLGYLFLVFSDLGLNQYLTKTLAGDQEKVKTFFPNVFTLKIIFSLLYPFLVVLAAFFIGYSSEDLWLLFNLSMVQGLLQIGMLFRSKYQAFQYFGVDSVASIIERIVLLVLVFFTMTYIDLDLFVADRMIAALVNVLVLLGITLYLFGGIKLGFDYKEFKRILKSSLPFGLIAVFYSVHEKIDQVLLERIAGAEATGIYAAAYRWVDASMMYLWLVLPVFFARFAFLYKDKVELNKLMPFAQLIALLPIILISGFVFIYGDKFFFLFDKSTPEEMALMTRCLKILFISVLVNGYLAVYGTLLSATGSEKFMNQMLISSVLLNVLINLWLIPQYQETGAAIATVVSASFMNLTYFIRTLVRKEVEVPVKILSWGIIASLVYIGSLYGLDYLGLNWLLSSVVAVMLFGAVILASGILNWRDLVQVIKKRS